MKTVSVCGQINSEEEIEFMQFRDSTALIMEEFSQKKP